MRRFTTRAILLATAASAVSVAAPNIAVAAPAHGGIVEEQPQGNTPHFRDGDVRALLQIGDRVIVGGSFDRVAEGGTSTMQENLAAYDRYTGDLDLNFLPQLDGRVRGLADGGNGTVIAVGEFNSVNGINRRKIVKLDLATGAVITAFNANASAYVNDVHVQGDRVYMGGVFQAVRGITRQRLAAVDLTTGDPLPDFDFPITTQLGWGLEVRSLDVSTDGSTLLVGHTGRHIGGEYRPMIAMIDITAAPVLSAWSTDHFDYHCQGQIYPWMRDAKFSPDGSYIATVSAVGNFPVGCDVSVRFPTAIDPDGDVDFDWVANLFDTPEAVAITDTAVYVGGHFTSTIGPGTVWTDYPVGNHVKNPPGSVPRYQIAALSPADGTGLPWNPGATGHRGVLALEVTEDALLGGSDGNDWGTSNRGHHGLFHLPQPADTARPTSVVVAPLQDETLPSGTSVVISGSAADDVAVKTVKVALRDLATGLWIQPDGSFGAWNRQRAVVTGGATANATWTMTYPSLPDGQFESFVYGQDTILQYQLTPTKRRFSVNSDTQAPVGSIAAPTAGQVLISDLLAAQGTATDDVAVASVEVLLKDRVSKQWLRPDGTWGVWAALPANLSAPGTPATDWDFSANIPDGSYRLEIRVTDSSGLRQEPRPRVDFTVDTGTPNLPPELVFPSPSPDGDPLPAGALTLKGSATDDSGVNRVQIEVRDRDTGDWLQPDGSWGPWATQTASIDPPGAATISWGLDIKLPAGRFRIFARAVDEDGLKSAKLDHTITVE